MARFNADEFGGLRMMGEVHVRKRERSMLLMDRWMSLFASKQPVHVYHHVPKCGGTSVRAALREWFTLVEDYRKGWTEDYPNPVDLRRLHARHCLCGHFELDGYYLGQRYPEVFASDRYRVFTFVRDPLEIQLSLFRYEQKNGQAKTDNIEEHLSLRPNYLAERFPVNKENYRSFIDQYFFVGVLEKSQESLDLLATLIGKRQVQLPWVNRSRAAEKNFAQSAVLSADRIARFREENELDYLVYDYCQEKLQLMLDKHQIECEGEQV
jgi:hypothetical protein